MMRKNQHSATTFGLMWLMSVSTITTCQNIDVDRPILREVSGLEYGSLFGYSLVLHQTSNNPATMAEALSGAKIVASAPKGTAPGGRVSSTGLVYSCPVNPGNCSPLPGKLFDATANSDRENKTDQFLGASMASNGERFVVCAHRHVTQVFRSPLLLGKCFLTDERSLEIFEEYQPCLELERIETCQAGASSVIVPDGNSYAFGVGAPSYDKWKGTLIKRTSSGSTRFRDSDDHKRFDYQGYAITSGRFRTHNRIDFAVSLPRSNELFGSVTVVRNDGSLRSNLQTLRGLQMGEYYGFSLLAANLDGDNYDELLVGAPLFTTNKKDPETGRVFLYRNRRGRLEFSRTIEGLMPYSRFGYALANLGDINGDGFDDVAISAPFTETGSDDPGTVLIYHSTPSMLLSEKPRQIIRGTHLKLSQGLNGLKGFGTSLSSGVDVDLNGYNDLLIGSFVSQKVFLLRTRALARVHATVSANPMIVNVMEKGRSECVFDSAQHTCFNLSACATYNGLHLSSNLNLRFNIIGDIKSIEKRLFFENGKDRISTEIVADISTQSCAELKAYIRNDTMDIFNPFVIEVSVDNPPREITIGTGNDTLEDLRGSPIIVLDAPAQVEVETLKECGGGDCVPDLRVEISSTSVLTKGRQSVSGTTIIAGLVSSVDFMLDIENTAEDAFQAILSFVVPTNLLEFANAFNQTRKGEVTLRCKSELVRVDNQLDMTQYNCSIGNPFPGPGSIHLRVQLNPSNGILGNERNLLMNFTVSSLNPENDSTIMDNSNFAVQGLSFEARANISIDSGVVTPEQVSYSDNSALSNGATINNVTQLGPPVEVSFTIRNSGPSRISEIQLDVSWPLNGSLTGENYYLYITSIKSSKEATVTCNSTYINLLRLKGDIDSQEHEESTTSMGSGRRRKRSTLKRTLAKRQGDVATDSEQGSSENRTLNCMESGVTLNCVNIRCSVFGLPGSRSVQVDINSRLDERFFSLDNDRYVFTPTASISIVNGEFIKSNNGSTERSTSAEVRVIPAARIVTVGERKPVPWWAIFVPILVAVIIIVIVAILLWVFGFFHRKKHEEIKQKREELQNLAAHGVSPATVSGCEPLQHGEHSNQYTECVDPENDSSTPHEVSHRTPGFNETTYLEADYSASPLRNEAANIGSGLRHVDEGFPGVAAQLRESHIPDPVHDELEFGVSGSRSGDDLEGTYLEL